MITKISDNPPSALRKHGPRHTGAIASFIPSWGDIGENIVGIDQNLCPWTDGNYLILE